MSYVRVRDNDLWCLDHGSGPLALFLHAYMTDHTMWCDQVRDLADLRRCVAPDLAGFGRSDPIVPGSLSYEAHAEDIAALIGDLGVGAADVVGFSAGATVALHLWKDHPDLVRSVALVSASLGPAGPPADGPAAAPGERGAPDYLDANARRAVYEGKASLFDRFQVAGYHFGPQATLTAKARYRSMFEGTRTDMMVATFQLLAKTPDLRHVLPTITVPVLFIRGEDESAPVETVEAVARLTPDARISVIPGSGRFVMLENPPATSVVLREFWNEGR